MSISYSTIKFTIEDRLGHLEFNQPPSNEMTLEFFSELGQVTEEMHQMKDLKAVVISGKGRHFSSGARLTELLEKAGEEEPVRNGSPGSEMQKFLSRNNRSFLWFEEANIPVISAIRGACLGSALEITLFTHFRFCGEDAVFGLPETTFNLVPGIGGISRIVGIAGPATALELALRGNTFSAEEALKLHLVDLILPKKEVVEKAKRFARSLPENYRKEKSALYLKRYLNNLSVESKVN
jgi:enoyl-CoA hydratase